VADVNRIAVAVALVAGMSGCGPSAPATGEHLGICVEQGLSPDPPEWGRRLPDKACTEGPPPRGTTVVLWLRASDPRPIPAVGGDVDMRAGLFDRPADAGCRFGAPEEGSPTVMDAWKAARRG